MTKRCMPDRTVGERMKRYAQRQHDERGLRRIHPWVPNRPEVLWAMQALARATRERRVDAAALARLLAPLFPDRDVLGAKPSREAFARTGLRHIHPWVAAPCAGLMVLVAQALRCRRLAAHDIARMLVLPALPGSTPRTPRPPNGRRTP